MKDMLISKRHVHGFALPTILIVSVVMIMILSGAVAATSAITASIGGQYYNQLAREAAESGVARAEACLRTSAQTPTWSNASPLAPDKNCDGSTISGKSPTVMIDGNIRTSFSVGLPTPGPSGVLLINATGSVQLTKSASASSVWRTYNQAVTANSRYQDTPQIGGGAGWKNAGHIAFMIAQSGQLYMWGDNSQNEIGDSSLGSTVATPVRVVLPTGVSHVLKAMTTGEGASAICIIGDDRQVYCQGNGIPGASTGPWVRFGLPGGLTATDISVSGYGLNALCVLASDQHGYCVGENVDGSLGDGNNSYTVVPIASPVQFAYPNPISKIVTSSFETCAIAVAGSNVYCAGYNTKGQLGYGTTGGNANGMVATPVKAAIPGGLPVADIRLAYHSPPEATFFLTQSGSVYSSGSNFLGTIGDGSTNGTIYNTPVTNATLGSWNDMVSIGQDGADNVHSMCIMSSPDTSSGAVWCTGQNKYGQLGNGTDCTTHSSWAKFILPAGETTRSFAMADEAGYQMNSMMVITQSGKVFAAGDNTYGKLGPNQPIQACNSTPKQIPLPINPSTGQMVKAVAISNRDEYSSYILGDDGSVYALGRNNNGQLGDGTTTDRSTAVKTIIPRQAIVY